MAEITHPTTRPATTLEDARAEHTTTCRSCGAGGLVPVLDLGLQPLANALRHPDQRGQAEPRFPLDLALCRSCSLVQILDSIPPEAIFTDYPYFSSVIPTLVEHARVLATRIVREQGLGPGDTVVELASNDGYLLQHYGALGVRVLGIEPARNIAEVAEARGIPTLTEFFGREMGVQLAADGIAPAVVHAHNVLAHVPDLNGFVAGISALIHSGGCAVIEAPYVKDLLDDCEFDTIYHEHLCYYSLTAIDALFRAHDLRVERVERIPIHGGSLRIFARRTGFASPDPTVAALLAEERGWGVGTEEPYIAFAREVVRMKESLSGLLAKLKDGGYSLAAYGAAAKGSTLLNTFGIDGTTLDFVADASPHKQGYYTPGSDLEVRPPSALLELMPDYVLLLAWNFADEILEQQREYRARGGRFIVPIPQLLIR